MTKPPYNSAIPLPSYLLQTEPLEIEDLPLHISLLTMELASQRQQIESLNDRLALLRSETGKRKSKYG